MPSVKRLHNLLGKALAFPRSWFWLFLLAQTFQATAQPDTLWIHDYPGYEAYDLNSDEEGNLYIAGPLWISTQDPFLFTTFSDSPRRLIDMPILGSLG